MGYGLAIFNFWRKHSATSVVHLFVRVESRTPQVLRYIPKIWKSLGCKLDYSGVFTISEFGKAILITTAWAILKRPGLLTAEVILLHDNARPQITITVKDCLSKFRYRKHSSIRLTCQTCSYVFSTFSKFREVTIEALAGYEIPIGRRGARHWSPNVSAKNPRVLRTRNRTYGVTVG